MKILILGGGLAGLSAAVELLDRGHEVTVLEGAKMLGGKAASWRDEEGDIVDLGQHVVTPLYQHFLALLRKVGAERNLIWKEGDYILALRGGKVGSIRIARLPPPLHFLVGLLRYRNLPLVDRLSGIPALVEILLSTEKHRRKFDDRAFVEWVRSRGASKALIEQMFEPMIEGLMFLNCREVSAANVMFDLHDMLLNAEAARFGFFDGGLNETLIQGGGKIQTGHTVKRLHFDRGAVSAVELEIGAAPPARRLPLRHPLPPPLRGAPARCIRRAVFRRTAQAGPGAGDRRAALVRPQGDEHRQPGAHPGLSLQRLCRCFEHPERVPRPPGLDRPSGARAPAKHLIPMEDQRIVRELLEDFRDVFPATRHAKLVKSAVVKTPLAFHCQFPGAERLRPDQRTPVSNLVLSGEFTHNHYPPCMEGAVMSGILAAACAHKLRPR
jgi:zeta-carotene desaturase